MLLLLPTLAFLLGYSCVQLLQRYRAVMAMLLARVFIPILILYHLIFDPNNSWWLIGFSLASSVLFYGCFYALKKDPLRALCFSYLNGAWLGFPFALAIFGTEAMSIIVALYIGGSLFGNVCAVMALKAGAANFHHLSKNVLTSPPVMAVIVAVSLSFWDLTAYQQHWLIQLFYHLDKFLVTFTGMCILGDVVECGKNRRERFKTKLILA